MRGGRPILVVDDDPSLRLLCRVNLELEGHRVVEAASLAEARALLAADPPAVALLDVHVGVQSGLDLIDELRALAPPAAIVLLTGSSDVSAELRARVDAVLGKPFALGELSGAVARLAGSVGSRA